MQCAQARRKRDATETRRELSRVTTSHQALHTPLESTKSPQKIHEEFYTRAKKIAALVRDELRGHQIAR
ncbi:MAG: hypothetical protein DCC68_23175 [Planctomycetota bacterium]|nr:MAG: hypothetical protein DCC68_23175 [Planctomycetota bacterium]